MRTGPATIGLLRIRAVTPLSAFNLRRPRHLDRRRFGPLISPSLSLSL
jgi:hypothetical protein